jgi:mRNA-degrading endonuclease RelE of RelBE toxin-antitoxin system
VALELLRALDLGVVADALHQEDFDETACLRLTSGAVGKRKARSCPPSGANLTSSTPLAYAVTGADADRRDLDFTRRLQALLDDEEYRLLQLHLAGQPEAGAVIKGTGGLRKVRWSVGARGKRGGVRLIYYWSKPLDRILMLLIYSKSERDDLTPGQLKILRRIVEAEYP